MHKKVFTTIASNCSFCSFCFNAFSSIFIIFLMFLRDICSYKSFEQNFDPIVGHVSHEWFSIVFHTPAACFCLRFTQRGKWQCSLIRGVFLVSLSDSFTHARAHAHTHTHSQKERERERDMQLYLTTGRALTQQDVAGWMCEVWRFTQAMTNIIWFSELIIPFSVV